MLHEILLGLSGHPSPLFEDHAAALKNTDVAQLTPAELALLQPLGLLATLHRNIRSHANSIANKDISTLARSVANRVVLHHLEHFQEKILDVERGILTRDSRFVGAYNIVPLASLVSEFQAWRKRLEYLWEVVGFIEPITAKSPENIPSGPSIIAKLRGDSFTGYPDVGDIAKDLAATAEKAWLQHFSTWILYGKLLPTAESDFFIRKRNTSDTTEAFEFSGDHAWQRYSLDQHHIPVFMNMETASSALFIGRCLNHLARSESAEPALSTHRDLLPAHLEKLSSLTSPISVLDLAAATRHIRHSLATNLITKVLPIHQTVQTLKHMRQFLLFGRKDFAEVLISRAESYLQTRQLQSMHTSRDLAGMVMKEGEVSGVLAHTLLDLESLSSKDVVMDEELEWAREHVRLLVYKPSHAPKIGDSTTPTSDRFNDFLLSGPTLLTLSFPSNHSLFFTSRDLKIYSFISNYLVALRRAHYRLTDLWRRNRLRRDVSAIKALSSKDLMGRRLPMRAVWATCTTAVSVLSALGQYFNGEVIEKSWNTFHRFVIASEELKNDPEQLGQAHQQYLEGLLSSLLILNPALTKTLRALLHHCDQLVGYVDRLARIWDKSDTQSGSGKFDGEENDVKEQLQNSCNMTQTDLRDLLKTLQTMEDHDRVSENLSSLNLSNPRAFKPWNGSVDLLLLRLDRTALETPSDEI